MIKEWHMKRGFMALLVIGFLMMAIRFYLEPHPFEKAFHTIIGEQLEYFSKIESETHKKLNNNNSESNLDLRLPRDQLAHSKTVTIRPDKLTTTSKCSYDSCPTGKPGFLNVHVVLHSHLDLGFAWTYDHYYYGEGNIVGVIHVIDSVIEGLKDNPHRKFMLAEIAFFQRWWNAQNETGRNIVKNLVSNGQLEFINGGWSVNDEAVTHYVDIIDQMSLGSNFLNETFGECGRPKVGWQIDTFGHSKEYVNLLAQMGFDGIFIRRMHQMEMDQRKKSKTMNFVWAGNHNFGSYGKLFTGVLYYGFHPPEYLCLKKDYFNETWVNAFLDYVKVQQQSYRTTDIMVPLGSDFRTGRDLTCFDPTDKLIKRINDLQEMGSKINLMYSTVNCYLKALNNHHNVTWPSKTDDMFPYVTQGPDVNGTHQIKEDYQQYWTGFFTSHPAFKYMVRDGSNLLQSCKQMVSYLSMKSAEVGGNISVMKQAMGVMQHHDAVTGTSRQFVIDDYIRILSRGFEECLKIQNAFYQNELPRLSLSPSTVFKVSFCNLNMSQCDVTEKAERVIVNVYNSLGTFVNKYVRIPVLNQAYRIFDPSGKETPFDIIPIPEFVKSLPGRNSSATHELIFLAFKLPPLGSKSYYIEVENKSKVMAVKSESNGWFIENQRVIVQLNEKNGLIKSISVDDLKLELEQEIAWYPAREPADKNAWTGLNSAIYMLRTNQTNPFPARKQEKISVMIYKGGLVQEIHQQYNGWVGQVIRLYKGQNHIELDWVVGPIDIEDNVGKEIVNRVTTKLSTSQKFYTDANGRQILTRKFGVHGDLINVNITDTVGGNYYPINAHISIKDETVDKQLTLLVDRAQGGSSLNDGQLELMVHRRHVLEGLWDLSHHEALNETAYGVGLTVRGTHLLVLSSISESAKLIRSLSHKMYKQPQISFINTNLSLQEWNKSFDMETRLLNEGLPFNVNLLTLDERTDGTYLLRLEHIYDVGEDVELSRPVVVNLRQAFFNGFTITSAEETTLGGNQFKKDSKRLVWTESNDIKKQHVLRPNTVVDIENIILHPMEIRTFMLKIEKNTLF